MKALQKIGGLSALYLALAYIINIVIFLVILDYPNMTDNMQKVALVIQQPNMFYLTNILAYVGFGFFFILFTMALAERLEPGARSLVRFASITGYIWAGSLIAGGMVQNAAIAPTLATYASDPALAATNWSLIETISGGLGNANGEVLGGIYMLMMSLAGLRTGVFTRWMHYLGLFVGAIGLISVLPGLADLAGAFGMAQIVWFIWMGVVLLTKEYRLPVVEQKPLMTANN